MDRILTVTYFVWFLLEVLLGRLMQSSKKDKKQTDKNSLAIIWVAIIFGIFFSIYIDNKWYLPLTTNAIAEITGFIFIIIGIIFRLLIIKSLGRFFTVDVTIRENHQLKTDGFYHYLRHPSYFASLLSFVGFGISLNNWVSLIIITIIMLSAFIRRIKVEEAVLLEQFGIEYENYKKITKALIPFVY